MIHCAVDVIQTVLRNDRLTVIDYRIGLRFARNFNRREHKVFELCRGHICPSAVLFHLVNLCYFAVFIHRKFKVSVCCTVGIFRNSQRRVGRFVDNFRKVLVLIDANSYAAIVIDQLRVCAVSRPCIIRECCIYLAFCIFILNDFNVIFRIVDLIAGRCPELLDDIFAGIQAQQIRVFLFGFQLILRFGCHNAVIHRECTKNRAAQCLFIRVIFI